MRRIAMINPVGGVGKTAIAAGLGHALALAGERVAMIDLDPRGHLAAALGIFRAPARGIDQALLTSTPVEAAAMGVRDMLTLIPAGSRLAGVERLQGEGGSRAQALRVALDDHLQDQAFVLIDTTSSSALLVANALFAADEVLIPVTPDQASLNGAVKVLLSLKRFAPYFTSSFEAYILLNRVQPRGKLSRNMERKLRQHFPELLLKSRIPEVAAIVESRAIGRTIFEYRAASPGARAFTELANELRRLGGRRDKACADADANITSSAAADSGPRFHVEEQAERVCR